MRVTEGMQYDSSLRALTGLASQEADAQAQATSGSRLTSPSADPIAAAQVVRLDASLAQANARRATIQTVQGDAELTENSLAQAVDIFQQAKALAVQGANGTLSASDRATLAQQVDGLRDSMLAIANTKGSTGYIFAGSKSKSAAFDSTAAYMGDDTNHAVDIGGATPTAVGVTGAQAFTAAGGQDVFAALSALGTALSSNDVAGITASMSALDASHDQIVRAQGQAGLVVSRLTASDTALQTLTARLTESENQIQGADPIAAYTSLSSLSASLQNAVAVTKQILGNDAFNRF